MGASILRAAVGLLYCAVWLWAGGFLMYVSAIPDAVEEGSADAIVVLTGGSDRLERGLARLAAGDGKRMLLSGVGVRADRADLRQRIGDGAQRRAFDCCVDLGRQAVDTRSNAAEARDWLAAHGFRGLRLVTANYHMPRARLLFRAAMAGTPILSDPVAPGAVRVESWWRHPGTARLLALEYSKYLLSLARIRLIGGRV